MPKKKPPPRGSQRPGGRTEDIRKAVALAVLKLIKEGNFDFSLQDVVRRAGVHRTTVYERWPDRAALLAEALTEHTSRFEIKLTGDWQRDLKKIGLGLRDFFSDPTEKAMNIAQALSSGTEFSHLAHRQWDVVYQDLGSSLRAAQARGDVRADIDSTLVIHMLVATILSLIVFDKQRPSDKTVTALVQHLIFACLPNEDISRAAPNKRHSQVTPRKSAS